MTDTTPPLVRVCFVCLGNICRSPTAEAVFREAVARANLTARVGIESAGTGGHHEGERADRRSRSHGKRRGYSLDGCARQFRVGDFSRFEHVIAMDKANLRHLSQLAQDDEARAKLSLFRAFDPASPKGSDIPDPYYGGDAGFDEVIDLCERACTGLLVHLRRLYAL